MTRYLACSLHHVHDITDFPKALAHASGHWRRSAPDSSSTRLIAPSLAPVQATMLARCQEKAAVTGGVQEDWR